MKKKKNYFKFEYVITGVLGKLKDKKLIESYMKNQNPIGRIKVEYLKKMLDKIEDDESLIGVYIMKKGKNKGQLAPLHCKGYFLASISYCKENNDKEFSR